MRRMMTLMVMGIGHISEDPQFFHAIRLCNILVPFAEYVIKLTLPYEIWSPTRSYSESDELALFGYFSYYNTCTVCDWYVVLEWGGGFVALK